MNFALNIKMTAISNSFPHAKVMLTDYMKRNNIRLVSEITDVDDIFRTLAERGDIETFVDMRRFFDILNDQHEEYGGETYDFNCLGTLYNAALCGHWDMILAILEPYLLNFDAVLTEQPDDFFDMIDGAIEGGHLHILEKIEQDELLSFLVKEFDPIFFKLCVRYRRYDILEFFLRRDNYQDIKAIETAATEMFHQADDEGMNFLLERFSEYRRIIMKTIRSQDFDNYTRPQSGIASSEELMPDIELANRLQRIGWLTQ